MGTLLQYMSTCACCWWREFSVVGVLDPASITQYHHHSAWAASLASSGLTPGWALVWGLRSWHTLPQEEMEAKVLEYMRRATFTFWSKLQLPGGEPHKKENIWRREWLIERRFLFLLRRQGLPQKGSWPEALLCLGFWSEFKRRGCLLSLCKAPCRGPPAPSSQARNLRIGRGCCGETRHVSPKPRNLIL